VPTLFGTAKRKDERPDVNLPLEESLEIPVPGEGRPRTAMLERMSQELLQIATPDVLDPCRPASLSEKLGQFPDAGGPGGDGLRGEISGIEMPFPGRDLAFERSLVGEALHASNVDKEMLK
jgi:hypothetical protein